MSQVEEEYPINMTELTECKDTYLDRNSENKSELIATTAEDEYGIEDIGYKQKVPHNDLRRKLNRNRGLDSPPAFKATTSNNYQPMTESVSYAQRKRDNDLRSKLNKNRKSVTESDSVDNWKRDSPSQRVKHTVRSEDLSPLKSPLHRSNHMIIFDIDNSHNFRFTNRRMESSQQTTLPRWRNKVVKNITHSPATNQKDDCTLIPNESSSCESFESKSTFSDSDKQEGTPVLSRIPREEVRQSWSRRKLHLPSENDNCHDANVKNGPGTKEDDNLRLARKEKDLAYGRNTEAYKLYIVVVPLKTRSKMHPHTPDKYKNCSRRSWDNQVKFWKRKLHAWADEYQRDSDVTNDDSEKTNSEPTMSFLEHMNDEEDGMDTLEDTFDLSDTNKAVVMNDDDSFLNSMDIALLVSDQMEDSVTLNDDA